METLRTPAGGLAPPGLDDALAYPFFQTVFDRKSRRVGLGMSVDSDVLAYDSPYEPVPLTELEEALLCTAGTGLMGLNLGDLDPARGMSTLVQWTTRTWPSSCSSHGTELFFTNDAGTYMLDMFGLQPEPGEIATLSGKPQEAQVEWLLDLYRRARVELQPGRAPLPTTLPGLFDFNQWNANLPGTTLFVPVTDTTLEYINLLFIYLSRSYGFSIVDEQAGGRSAGLQGARRRPAGPGPQDGDRRARAAGALDARGRAGLHLPEHQPRPPGARPGRLDLHGVHRPPRHGRGRRPRARLPLPGGRLRAVLSGGAGRALRGVRAAVPRRHGRGRRRGPGGQVGLVRRRRAEALPGARSRRVGRPANSRGHRALVKDYCRYVHETYGRFPLYVDPMYQRLTVQAQHADPDFYERYYSPGALTEQHHEHFARWHPELADARGQPPRRGGG